MNEAFVSGILDNRLPTSSAVDSPLPALSAALALDLALEADNVEGLCKKYQLTYQQFQTLVDHPVFSQLVNDMRAEIRERGMTFRMKASVQADMYLEQVHKMVMDENIPSSVRADLIKSTVKWADLEPKQKGSGEGSGPAFKLVINMPPPGAAVQPAVVVENAG